MDHKITGHNFHGRYGLILRGPKEGFRLSARQHARLQKEICGVADCRCGGGYGDGMDAGSARIEQADYDHMRLVPAG